MLEIEIINETAVNPLIDKFDIESFLNAIAEICDYKARHIDENWQESGSEYSQASQLITEAASQFMIATGDTGYADSQEKTILETEAIDRASVSYVVSYVGQWYATNQPKHPATNAIADSMSALSSIITI